MLPQAISRIRTGVNRLFRWRYYNVAPIAADPIHLSSCILDFWYTAAIGTSTDGRFLSWPNLAALPETWSAGSPGFLYNNPNGTGVYNNGAGTFTGTTRTLTGALTLYWLADYAGVDGVPLSSEVNGQFSISGTTAKIVNDAGTSKTKDGTLDGNRLYRWRRTSANACYFKPGAGTEVDMGTLAGDISVSALLPIADPSTNRTRRVVMYNVDLVEQSLQTGVEAAIVDVMNNQVTVTITSTGTWQPGDQCDLSKSVTFEVYGAGGDGGPCDAVYGGAGGGGGGYARIVAPSMTALSFNAASTFSANITTGTAKVTDPNSLLICEASPGSTYTGQGQGGQGTASDGSGYIGAFTAKGGNGGGYDGALVGGSGGGGSGGKAGNGVAGQNSPASTGGAGGTVNFSGGHGYSAGTNGTTPGGGGGGAETNTNSGNPATGGAARIYITYYLNTTP